MTRGPQLRDHPCAVAQGWSGTRAGYFDAGVVGVELNVPLPLPGWEVTARSMPLDDGVLPPIRSVPLPLPGCSVGVWFGVLSAGAAVAGEGLAVAGAASAAPLATRMSPTDVRPMVGTNWESERMNFSCKGVLENDLAEAHRPYTSRREAVLRGDDLPAARTVVGERSMRDTDSGPPCEGCDDKTSGLACGRLVNGHADRAERAVANG